MDDLYPLIPDDTAVIIYKKFKKYWNLQLNYSHPNLSIAYFKAFGLPFLFAAILKLIHDSCLFAGPYLLNKLIKYLSSNPPEPLSLGLYYVFGLFITNFLMSLCLRQYFWLCYRVGMNLRLLLLLLIYYYHYYYY